MVCGMCDSCAVVVRSILGILDESFAVELSSLGLDRFSVAGEAVEVASLARTIS